MSPAFHLFKGDTSRQQDGKVEKVRRGRGLGSCRSSSLYGGDVEAQRGQEGAQGHTASRGCRLRQERGICLFYLGSSGLLCPLLPAFPPLQKRKMFLDLRQKNEKLKSEPWVLGKEYREGRHILGEQRAAYSADRKHSVLPKFPSTPL